MTQAPTLVPGEDGGRKDAIADGMQALFAAVELTARTFDVRLNTPETEATHAVALALNHLSDQAEALASAAGVNMRPLQRLDRGDA